MFSAAIPFHRRPALLLRIAFACAVGFGLCGGSKAYAGCADYVWVRDAQGRLVPAAALMDGHQAPPAARDAAPIRKLPCRGPACGGIPSAPATPVSLPHADSLVDRHGLALQADDGRQGTGARWLVFGPTSMSELFRPQDVFEPPR